MSVERRSPASQLYRLTIRPRIAAALVLIGVAGWTVVLTATPLPTEAEAASYWKFFMAALGAVVGLMTLFGAGLALGARWVAEPAARKVLLDHVNMGSRAHEALVSRVEWDIKHEALRGELSNIARELAKLTERLELSRKK